MELTALIVACFVLATNTAVLIFNLSRGIYRPNQWMPRTWRQRHANRWGTSHLPPGYLD